MALATTERRRGGVAITVVVGTLISLVLPVAIAPAGAGADPISDKRKQAAAISAQLDQLEEQASIADEAYNQARAQLDALDKEVAAAQAATDAADNALALTRTRVQQYAVNAYVHADQADDLLVVLSTSSVEATPRQGYIDVAIGKDRRLADQFKTAREDANANHADFAQKRALQAQLKAQVESDQASAAGAVAAEQAVLNKVQGELATLVKQEEERKAKAAAAAAAAAVARQAAADRARGRGAQGVPGAGVHVPPPSPGAAGAVAAAMSQLGVPYIYAASSPGTGFDCSGLTMWAWGRSGHSLPHSAAMQMADLTPVPLDQLQPGDLLFFGRGYVHHVGMYIGNGKMIEAPHTGAVVRISDAFRPDLVGAGRP